MRQLVTNSLKEYLEFFRRFKKKALLTPLQIMEKDKNIHFIEDCFLVVKLKDDENSIKFENPLGFIKSECLKIIRAITDTTNNFARPELDFARTENKFLWKVPKDDYLINEITKEIDEIIETNNTNIQTVLKV